MKVICKDKGSYHLTIGKIYEVSNYQYGDMIVNQKRMVPINKPFKYLVTNDIGYKHGVEGNLFIKLSEYRNSKINQICGI